ncbi:hypothetical protein N878_26605 [Pseudomonas sp. EGD-AK9]|nr:hypothetical protein N878_26605 [Pseudomonas sp. EGD-AK9]
MAYLKRLAIHAEHDLLMRDQSRKTDAVQANAVLLRSSCSWENFFFIRMSLLLFFTDF